MNYLCTFLLIHNTAFPQFVGIKIYHSKEYEQEHNHTKNICTPGEEIQDYVIPPKFNLPSILQHSYVESQESTPDDIIVEVLIIVDDKFYNRVGKLYRNGIWNKDRENQKLSIGDPRNETIIYLRKLHGSCQLYIQELSIKFKNTPDDKDAIDPYKTLARMSSYFVRDSFRKVHHFDIVIFLTGKEKLCKTQCKNKRRFNGISYVGGVCLEAPGKTFGGIIVSDNGAFHAVETTAHEIGPQHTMMVLITPAAQMMVT